MVRTGATLLLLGVLLPLAVDCAAVQWCRFGNSSYAVGETWYPRVADRQGQFCTRCTCQQEGNLDCKGVECDKACSEDFEEHLECCNICREAELVGSAFSRDAEPQVRSGRTSPAPCIHNQQLYTQGQRFTSNDTSIVPIKDSQCVQCVCEDTAVHCKLVDCLPARCANPQSLDGSCCPVCPGDDVTGRGDRSSNSGTGVTGGAEAGLVPLGDTPSFSVDSPSPRVQVDCISGGKVYPNGATWHPVMGPFGRLACQLCRCRAGRVECSRLQCPRPSCARPLPAAGRCCPLCEPAPTDRSIGLSGETALCAPAQRVVIVYRSHAGANVSQYIQYIFERPGRYSGQSEKHEWTFRNDTIQTFRVDKVSDFNVSELKRFFHWKLLGTTNPRRLTKFRRRAQSVRQRCSSGCSKRVLRLERTLRLQPAVRRSFCRPGERRL